MHLHRIGLIVFCVALTLIFVGTIVCCFWLKKADASRQIRAKKAAEARARAARMIGAPNPVNEALLTVPQVPILCNYIFQCCMKTFSNTASYFERGSCVTIATLLFKIIHWCIRQLRQTQ